MTWPHRSLYFSKDDYLLKKWLLSDVFTISTKVCLVVPSQSSLFFLSSFRLFKICSETKFKCQGFPGNIGRGHVIHIVGRGHVIHIGRGHVVHLPLDNRGLTDGRYNWPTYYRKQIWLTAHVKVWNNMIDMFKEIRNSHGSLSWTVSEINYL